MDPPPTLNLEDFAAKGPWPKAEKSKRPPRHRPGGAFLSGPVPWDWLSAASHLPGKALHVSIVLWRLVGLEKKRTVKWRPSEATSLGLDRHAVYRGLTALEGAGLVSVKRARGRAPEVTILDRHVDDETCRRESANQEKGSAGSGAHRQTVGKEQG